jgi:molybdopterin-guanine dinucleotide biosynthesis protein A
VSEVIAAILAGGQSERFGKDKALLKFGEMYLLDYIYSELKSLVSEIWVIGKRREEVAIATGSFVQDKVTGIGPLGGLYTALTISSNPVLLVPCDMPFLRSSHLNYLMQNLDITKEATIAVSAKGIEPLLGIYNPATLPKLEGFIKQNDFALYRFLKGLDTKYVEFADNDENTYAFFNINTFSDYKKALYLKGRS